MLSRRGLLGAIIASPAIVRASSLMPVKQMLLPDPRDLIIATSMYHELCAITRHAFVPDIFALIHRDAALSFAKDFSPL